MENYEEIVQEFIDLINFQSGVYMDSIGGFSGHIVRVKRQVARAMKPVQKKTDPDGTPVIVYTSYEVEGEPDVVMHRTIRAKDFIASNSVNGANEKQLVRSIIIFIYTFWEKEIRPRLAASKGVEVNDIGSDIMGDLRIVRNAILHDKAILNSNEYEKIRKIKKFVMVGEELHLPYENMHQIFVLIKQDLARMLMEHFGANDGTVNPEEIVSVAVQKVRNDP